MKVMLGAELDEVVGDARDLLESKTYAKLCGTFGIALMQKVKKNEYKSDTTKYRDLFKFFSVLNAKLSYSYTMDIMNSGIWLKLFLNNSRIQIQTARSSM